MENDLFEKDLSFNPISIWEVPKKNQFLKSLIKDEDENREVKRTGGALGEKGIRFSEFKADIAYRIIEYWGEKATTVLDPFSGRYTRMIISLLLKKDYIGFDVVPEYVEANKKRYQEIQNVYQNNVVLCCSDGCKMRDIKDNSCDFIFTCPPYYNLEIYKDAPNQLSRLADYKSFLTQIEKCLYNCHRVLKKESYCVFVVGDWHKNGEFFCFHNDLISIAQKTLFKIHDIVINKIYSPFAVFASTQNKRFKWVGKTHEYILVFKA